MLKYLIPHRKLISSSLQISLYMEIKPSIHTSDSSINCVFCQGVEDFIIENFTILNLILEDFFSLKFAFVKERYATVHLYTAAYLFFFFILSFRQPASKPYLHLQQMELLCVLHLYIFCCIQC